MFFDTVKRHPQVRLNRFFCGFQREIGICSVAEAFQGAGEGQDIGFHCIPMRSPTGVIKPDQPFRAGPDATGNVRALLLRHSREECPGFEGIRQDRRGNEGGSVRLFHPGWNAKRHEAVSGSRRRRFVASIGGCQPF